MKITYFEILPCLYIDVWICGAVATARGCWIVIFCTFFFVCRAVPGPHFFGQIWQTVAAPRHCLRLLDCHILYIFLCVSCNTRTSYFGQIWHITECCRLFLGWRLAFLTEFCILLVYLSFSGKCWKSTFLFLILLLLLFLLLLLLLH